MSRLYRNVKFIIRKKWKSMNDYPIQHPFPQIYQTASSVFRIAVRDVNSELIISPVQNKRIVKLVKKGLYIKIERYNISITNHKYNYTTDIPISQYEKLINMFDSKMDIESQREEQIMVNQSEIVIENILKSILDKK